MPKHVFRNAFKVNIKQLKSVLIYLTAICVICLTIYLLKVVRNERSGFRPRIYLWSHLGKTADNKCRLPLDIDPWDESVRRFLRNDGPRRFICAHNSYEWTETDDKGVIHKKCSNCFCMYWLYGRQKGNDRQIEWSDGGIIEDSGIDLKAVNEDHIGENRFAYVECHDLDSGQKYRNHHYWFVPKNKTFQNRSKSKPSGGPQKIRPSVLILVIESLSRLNFLRHMQLTKKSFERLGNVFYLKGLNKMADNSFPNMIPFLTGQDVNHFGGRRAKGPFDDYPFIWKKFSAEGYQTALMEDEYEITLFNEWEIGRKGFVRDQPVDWYTFPFWMTVEKTDQRSYAKCYHDRRPRVDIFLDQIKHFVQQSHANGLPFFGFTFFIQATHVTFNNARTLDGHYSQLLGQLEPILKDQFVILMGDHGCRFEQGGFLHTTIGRIEERMPLFSIHIPDSILSENPHLSDYLNRNGDQLTTWLDVHRMLEDIVNEEFRPIIGQHSESTSYSLWRQKVPENRTCAEALIPQIYCVCDQRRRLDASDYKTREIAQMVINKINDILPDVCHQLSPRVLITAEEITFPQNIPTNSAPKVNKLYEMTLEVNPSSAIIRSQIHFFANNTIELDSELTRLNPYGNQSLCVSEPLLKKICFCK